MLILYLQILGHSRHIYTLDNKHCFVYDNSQWLLKKVCGLVAWRILDGGNSIHDADSNMMQTGAAAVSGAVIFKYFNQNIQLLLYFITQTSA